LLLCGAPRFGRHFGKIIPRIFEINFQPSRRKAAVRADDFKKNFLFCPPSGGRKRWTGFNQQNPLDFAQNGFGFRPANTTKLAFAFFFIYIKRSCQLN